MTPEAQASFPNVLKVERNNIPSLLKSIDRYLVWRAGPLKEDGKFDKIPVSPVTGRNMNGLDPKNWLSYEEAIAAHDNGKGNGIGIVLSSDHPVTLNGEAYYLTALDFDDAAERNAKIELMWMQLGQPYVEISPSGRGLRMFALSKKPLQGGNAEHGREFYSTGRFVTVTGQSARGTVRDATSGLVDLHHRWFGVKDTKDKPQSDLRVLTSLPTTENVSRVEEQLSLVSSDTDYETWRNIVWSVLSTGWECAEKMAREWSRRSLDRYDEDDFDRVVKSFRCDGGISLGTLHHHAVLNGWKPVNLVASEELSVAGASEPALGETGVASRLLTARQVKKLPNSPYRVRGLLPAKGVAAVYGEPGSGKSFVAMDICFSIAAGHSEWFGMRIKPAPVIYVALEGQGGIKKRIQAWELQHEKRVAKNVRFLLGDFTLMDREGVNKLIGEVVEAVGEGTVVVIDTLAQSAPGADENASKDMGAVLANAQALSEGVNGLVLLIHHSGKDRAKGMRGHSSLIGAVDAAIEVTKDSSGRSWTVKKSKDDIGGVTGDFELVTHTVDTDEDGDDITSCAIQRTMNTTIAEPKPLSGKHQIAAMVCLRSVLAAKPAGISHEDATKRVAAALAVADGRRASVAKETIDRLIVGGHLMFSEGAIKLP